MEKLEKKIDAAKESYDRGSSPIDNILEISKYCIDKLKNASTQKLTSAEREYASFCSGSSTSRPFLPKQFETNPDTFSTLWTDTIKKADTEAHVLKATAQDVDRALYTSVMSVAICYDLWKPKSRKTPGTFFELLIGSVFSQLVPKYTRTKFVPLPIEGESVSTDIVLGRPDKTKHLVLPVKITTRDRIVQAYAHQRILDSVFGKGKYESVLICVSETQLDDKNKKANMICVPGTIKLYQQHLAQLGGIYYLDPPSRYTSQDMTAIIPVNTLGHLLTVQLPKHV